MNTTDRIRRYMESLPAAVSGARGHDALFRAACILSHGFALPDEEAWPILQEYNARCLPPWSERELRHKLTQAHTVAHSKPRGHLAGNAMPPRRPDPTEQPPRVLWRVTLDGTEPGPSPAPAPPLVQLDESSTPPDTEADPEAKRIAGELVKLHRDGHITGPDDPEARFMAAALAAFEAAYQPQART